MDAPENYETEVNDFRFLMLVTALEGWKVSEDDAVEVHNWLSSHVSELMQEQAISRVVDTQKHREQILACDNLAKSAELIANQFDFLSQFSSLDFAFRQAYELDNVSKWGAFRDRVGADAAVLKEVVIQTRTALKKRGAVKGKPAKHWKSRLVTELFGRLSEMSIHPDEVRAEVAAAVWSIYFPDDDIQHGEAAKKIVQRWRRKQGHK